MSKKPKRPDCDSCYHFSKPDFNESEGYCKIRKEWIDPHEGEDCEQFEPPALYCDTESIQLDHPFGATKSDNPVTNALFDTRAIKLEKYEELRDQDFDTWLDTILHEIIEQVNFDASEVDALGGAVWNGECPDGTPYPKQCAREDAYIQCIRQSNQLDSLKRTVSDLESQISSLQLQFDELKKFIGYTLADHAVNIHTGSDFCGNCVHASHVAPDIAWRCKLSGEIIDSDDSSCTMWETSLPKQCSNCAYCHSGKQGDRTVYVCELSHEVLLPIINSLSCASWKSKQSNQLDSKLFDKPDREECKHCPKEMCDNCMNYPF